MSYTIYHDINLSLMEKEMLSTCLLDLENEGKHNFTIIFNRGPAF